MNPLPYEYNATLVRVVDGDTIIVKVDLGFKVVIEQVVRLLGVNTPEIVGTERAAGLAAKEATEKLLATADNGKLRLKSQKPDAHDKYGRYLAEVHFEAKGVALCLNTLLVQMGLSKQL